MIKSDLKRIARLYGARAVPEFEWKPHVFPRYTAPVLVCVENEPSIVPMQFGLIPFFEKDIKPKKVFHNARRETIAEKVSFKKAFSNSRCIVPMESFFEYIWESKERKWLARFSSTNEDILSAAGIWSAWKSPAGEVVNTFSVITTEPPEIVAKTGHDRCPQFLGEQVVPEWLNPETKDPAQLNTILEKSNGPDLQVERANPD